MHTFSAMRVSWLLIDCVHGTSFSGNCAAQVTELISLSSKKFIELCRKLSDCETAQKASDNQPRCCSELLFFVPLRQGALACGDLGWVAPEAWACRLCPLWVYIGLIGCVVLSIATSHQAQLV